jgi:hypothetical protein
MSVTSVETQAQQSETGWVTAPAPDPEPVEDNFRIEDIEALPEGSDLGPKLLAGLLILLAVGWTGASIYALTMAWPGANLPAWIGWGGTFAAPLVLIGLAWLLFGRSGRRETHRFTQAVTAMRSESEALESTLAAVAARIEANRTALGEEAARLMSLGDEASDRIGRVTATLAREAAELDRKAQALDQAAEAARIDVGVLMSDLPRAEAQARAAAEAMK